MLFKGQRQSTNVEDVRGGVSKGVVGGGVGIGTLAIALIVYLLGGDPSSILQLGSQNSTPTATTTVQPQLTAEQKELTELVSVVLADTEDVWHKLFSESGLTYREPKMVLFSNFTSSACGTAKAAVGPFYCPGDEKLYLDLDFLVKLQQRLGAQGDFAVAYIVAHEVGHHVQNLLGTMNKVNKLQAAAGSQEEVNQYTLRLELQADFLAGVFIHHGEQMKHFMEAGDLEEALNAASAVGDDRIQMKEQGYVVPDSFTHGTAEQRKSWLKKGIDTGDYSQGNTFARDIVL